MVSLFSKIQREGRINSVSSSTRSFCNALIANSRKGCILAVCLLAIGLGAACSPDGKIAESSKNDECAAELTGALKTFSRDLGLPFQVTKEDAQSIFKTGKVAKKYARDGVQHETHFGIEKKGGDCKLKLFKRVERQPGSRSSRSGSFGTVTLKVCKCK